MLVLSRKLKQKIIINDNIEITILKTTGKQIKIGIEAPKEVTIYRKEVYPQAAATTAVTPITITTKRKYKCKSAYKSATVPATALYNGLSKKNAS